MCVQDEGASEEENVLAALLRSPEWTVACACFRRVASRCPRDVRDDVFAESVARLIGHVAAGRPVQAWTGFCLRVAQSAVRSERRRELCIGNPDGVEKPNSRPSFDDVVCGCRVQMPPMGRLQRRLVDGVVEGEALREIAESLKLQFKEIVRVAIDLAGKISTTSEGLGRNRKDVSHPETH